MPFRDLEAEDVALLVATATAAAAVILDEAYGSPIFKGAKILATLVSLGLALQRLRTSKPYIKDLTESDWEKVGTEYQVVIRRSEHGRGKVPTSRCLTKDERGAYHECFVGAGAREDGDVFVSEEKPVAVRVEIRK